jgi:hypothetical protein
MAMLALLSIIFFFIKFIALAYTLINFSALVDSREILNRKSFPLEDGFTNQSFLPKTTALRKTDVAIGETLSDAY